ncbi:V-type ATP synthase subunit D [Candidatus Woesearchaeota archaeon]|nr:V-type ATP synthase subunit D [Candidatus Woesearchaeota archaeon]
MVDVKPTRSELMKLKKRIVLARSGYNLLKKKRDGLILEFFEILKNAKKVREGLVKQYREALHIMNIARTMESDLKIKSIALAVKERPQVKVETKNIMGVLVPKIAAGAVKKQLFQRGYSVASSSSAIDQAAEAYERVVELVVLAAETETAMKKLLQEIEKTKRRVNALEFKVIPELDTLRKFISLRLEEMERENIFRMKRIKA